MKEKIAHFIQNGGDFNSVALKLFSAQCQQNRLYGRMCGNIRPTHWKEIPAVPVDLFRSLSLCCFPPFAAQFIFLTSGTTGKKGVHRLLDTDIYNLGSIKHMNDVIGSVPAKAISLVSTSSSSSLGHMCRYIAPQSQHFFVPEQGLYKKQAWEALRHCSEAIFFPGTSFAFAELVEGETVPCLLPKGSVMMITGGFKGYEQNINAQRLHQRLNELFPGTRLVAEYGMTELSSQLWSPNNDNRYIPPHWMRVLAVNPQTGKETEGIGQLRFYDLANHQSVMAIETQDQGEVLEDGSVILHGRLPKSPPRGCSLDLETVKRQVPPSSYAPHIRPSYSHTSPLSKENTQRLHSAFQEILNIPLGNWGQDLSHEQFRWGLQQSIKALSLSGLYDIQNNHTAFPKTVSIVASYGIGTSILEWVYLALGMGAQVHLKAPKRDDRFHQWLCSHLSKHHFPITCSTDRDLGTPELIYAFGNDQTMDDIRTAHPNITSMCYGHRFSLLYCSGDPNTAQQIATDICAYNGRGCMAPVAICTPHLHDEFLSALEIAIAEHQQSFPAPPSEALLQPFVRQHTMKTLAIGKRILRNDHHICVLPFAHWTQNTLPNVVDVHEVSHEELYQHLIPWQKNLSSLSTDMDTSICELFPRVVPLGMIQKPIFPREHDGYPMFIQP